jgi:Flp pilus assembly protein TadD
MQNESSARLAELHKVLAVCPSDVLARCDLALLLEQLDLHDEALVNWKTVLEFDPNNLKAREGVTRCRTRPARPFQSQR